MSKVSDKILIRVYVLLGAVVLFALAIAVQLVRLQFIQHEEWSKLADEERVYEKKVEAMRGNILADNGALLVTSVPLYRCSIDPSLIPLDLEEPGDRDTLLRLADSLHAVFGDDETYTQGYFYSRIASAKKKKKHFLYVLNQKVDYQNYQRMKTWPVFRNHPYKGGLLHEREPNRRGEPFDSLASYTLGRLDSAGRPIKGMENWFDEHLSGTDGTVLVTKLVGQAERPIYDFGDEAARDGSDIVTTINVQMQDIVTSALDSALREHNAEWGTAILMETKTGHVKAIANLGRHGESYREDFQYGIARRVEPGSTFKLASAIIALESNAIGLTDTIDTGLGFRQFYDRTMKDDLAYGKLVMLDGFRKSSNVYYSSAIHDRFNNHPEEFITWIKKLGLNQPVAPQVKGEPRPIIIEPDHKLWTKATLPWMSIGYNLQLTPLQICTFYNGVANDGKVMAPLLVSEVRNGTDVERVYEPKVLNQQVASPWVIREVKKMMEAVVEDGTARRIKCDAYKIAGKTGTAKKVKNGKYVKDYQASFAGYFPADKPKYTLYVLIDEPTEGGFYGGSVAAPCFRSIADQIYSLDPELNNDPLPGGTEAQAAEPVTPFVFAPNASRVYRELGIEAQAAPEPYWAKVRHEEDKMVLKKVEIKKGQIPNVVGMTARDALNLMEYVGQPVELVGHGKVTKQSFPAGGSVRDTEILTLELAR